MGGEGGAFVEEHVRRYDSVCITHDLQVRPALSADTSDSSAT